MCAAAGSTIVPIAIGQQLQARARLWPSDRTGSNAGKRSIFALPNEGRRVAPVGSGGRYRCAVSAGLRASETKLGEETSARLAQVAGHDLVPGGQRQIGPDDPGDPL